ncbi:VOC family protein [Micromonospora sp. NBC_01813]|uniref:VOC family protein n=1 Tax=Micromonospora sp. NBC_01813 TaxID=2975988 RepID=UPI002DDACDA7|nr:VOC family protein [Micromonospora sp. NBC_01813]WSA10738.1 VOC family protein [Micromonospora sp. NBC_01813]
MSRSFRPGEAVWVELCTPDPAKVENFYRALLGWTVRTERLGSTTYRMCSVDGRDVAGISDATGLHGGRPRGWIVYFAVDDIARSATQAVALGGELVTPPRYLPAAGTGAAVIDPFGATFGLYQGEARAGVQMLNSVGALCWNELDTGEPAASVAYYRSLFGYTTRQRGDGPTTRPYTLLMLADVPVAGVLALDNDWPNLIPSKWITYFAVASLDEALAQVSSLGGTPTVGPADSPYGRLHLVKDPAGHTLCLIQLEGGLRPGHDSSYPAVNR